MATKTVLFDGMKISPWNVDDNTGWTLLGPQEPTGIDAYFARVPWLYRGVIDRANMVGKMPFAISKGETDYDTSADYQNKLAFLPAPTRLFKQLEQSLAMTGRAYVFLETNKSGYVKDAVYCIPTSITEQYDQDTGELTGYKRKVGRAEMDVAKANIIAIYAPDYLTENGPAKSSAAKAALSAAGVLYNADKFIASYFERGAIKATILSIQGGDKNEMERLKSWFGDVVAGIKNAWSAHVLRGDAVKPTVIGEGLESLENKELTTERRQDIATALGVPESRLWSAAANYATAEQDMKSYYQGTIIPECDLIAEAFNSQLFTKEHQLAGYRLDFLDETLDIFQKDVNEQSTAAKAFIDFLTACPTEEIVLETCTMMGFELTDKMEAAIKKWFVDKKAKAEEIQQNMNQPTNNTPPMPPQNNGQEQQDGGEGEPPEPNPQEMRSALSAWKRKSLGALKRGEPASVEFDSSIIPARTSAFIRYELENAKTADEVKAVFEKATAPDDLTVELRKANELLEKYGGMAYAN